MIFFGYELGPRPVRPARRSRRAAVLTRPPLCAEGDLEALVSLAQLLGSVKLPSERDLLADRIAGNRIAPLAVTRGPIQGAN